MAKRPERSYIMGLIRLAAAVLGAGAASLNTTLGNSWIDYFESGDMSGGVIQKRANRIVGPRSKNKNSDENIISSGSIIDVQENQCMILVEDGAIVDFCAEPGRYQFDASQAPSALAGSNSGFAALAHSVVEQFKAGGQRVHTQRVYFINLGEIQGFKWGSGNITFDHWEKDWTTDKPIWHIATTLMGNGVYSIQVTDPGKFFSVIGAQATGSNGSGLVRREDIEPQIKSEAIAAIRQGVAGLNKLRIGYQDIAANEYQLTKDVDKLLDEEWHEARGISVFKIAINMLDADEKSKAQITKFQETRGYTDPSMLGAYMGIGQTQAAQAAAANTAGAITGFAAMGMMGQNNAGANIAGLMQQGAQQQAAKSAIQSGDTWTCSCGSVNTGKFCPNCGSPKPAPAAAAFCTNCGQPFPDPANPPKFCPNCGTKIG